MTGTADTRPRPTAPPVLIRPARSVSDWRRAQSLLTAYVEWLRQAVGVDPLVAQPGFAAELAALADHYGGPAAQLLVAADLDHRPVGMVGLRCSDGAAELKRLFVHPSGRGRGLGDRLVGAAIDSAVDSGARSIWLETVRGPMDPAIALYRRHGFEPVEGTSSIEGVAGLLVMNRPL